MSGVGQDQKPQILKIITIGMSGVGKTSFITRFADNSFYNSYQSTIGVDFKIKTLNIDDCNYKVQMWDTAGQERFRSISAAYYRLAHGLIFAMDPSQPDSLQTIARLIEDAMQHCDSNIQKILITTKSDLGINAWQTDSDAIEQFAEKNGMAIFRTSAKTGENVDLAVESLVKQISFNVEALSQQNIQKQNIENKQDNKSKIGRCC